MPNSEKRRNSSLLYLSAVVLDYFRFPAILRTIRIFIIAIPNMMFNFFSKSTPPASNTPQTGTPNAVSWNGMTTPKKESVQAANPTETLPKLDNTSFDPTRCKVVEIPSHIAESWNTKRKPLAFVIENILTPEECKRWIDHTEEVGYETALVNIGGGMQRKILDVRNSSRCIIDDADRARELFERIKHFLDPSLTIENKVPYELNERLRFLRYDPGEYFNPHLDGRYDRPDNHPRAGDYSIITFQLYLNDGFEGGTTRFFHSKQRGEHYDVIPKPGSVLLFEHRMEHSGEMVVSGRKYAIRTDIMFAAPDFFDEDKMIL
jgi:hypothetical protein